ncbi:hypothetical protein B0H34DRAFT_679976 [Crassisporium funariophilum]|nr:hypothetical protein B0H34DRAFT_679976 [Crassisporium funariophilum]
MLDPWFPTWASYFLVHVLFKTPEFVGMQWVCGLGGRLYNLEGFVENRPKRWYHCAATPLAAENEWPGDPIADDGAMHRSITRGSHNSHASVSASTRSWVYSNQINPPPPPPPVEGTSSSGHVLTPFHGPRPLPDPHYQVPRRPVHYEPAVQDEEEEEYMDIDPNANAAGVRFGYQNEGPSKGRAFLTPIEPSTVGSMPGSSARGGRTFVGGFFRGLKKLPKAVFGYGGSGGKRKLVRRGTFGTEATSPTATGMTTGNTLPRYLSNPSIGPSNPQFAHRLSIAVANGSLPPDASPAAFQSPPALVHPGFPSLLVTPPSEGIPEEDPDDFYDDEPTTDRPQQYVDPHERTTVMVYSNESEAPTIRQHSQPPTVTHLSRAPTVTQHSQTHTRHHSQGSSNTHNPHPPVIPNSGPRVSYASHMPTRANVQAQAGPTPMPTMVQIPMVSPQRIPMMPRQTPLVESPQDVLSPAPTSRYTMTTVGSYYDPSFASHLSPVEKFFKGLYHLPWIARERVTVDYRPSDSTRARKKVKLGVKKPMASWYKAVLSRSRRGSRDLDLLSGSNTATTSRTTSLGNSLLSPLASPISRRSGRSSNNNHNTNNVRHQAHNTTPHQGQRSKTRHRRRINSSSTAAEAPPHHTASPLIPTAYPYQYPAYPPYTYPYAPYPAPVPVPVAHASPPRGPRTHHRTAKYPHGYTPYQPMPHPGPVAQAPPPPMYFIAPSPPQSHDGGQVPMQMGQPQMQQMHQGAVQMSPVLMHYVPVVQGLRTIIEYPSSACAPFKYGYPQQVSMGKYSSKGYDMFGIISKFERKRHNEEINHLTHIVPQQFSNGDSAFGCTRAAQVRKAWFATACEMRPTGIAPLRVTGKGP